MVNILCKLIVIPMTIVAVTSAINPGMVSRITPRGFDFLRLVGVQKMEAMARGYHIPPRSGKAHGISYKVWNMRVISCKIPGFAIRAGPAQAGSSSQLAIVGSNIAMSMTGNFEIHFMGKHSGIFDVFISDVTFSFLMLVGADGRGRPHVSGVSSSCRFNANEVSVNLHGHKFISRKVADALKNNLNENGCGEIMATINNELEQYLMKLSMVENIYDGLDLDYSLVSNPTVNGSGFDIKHKGEVFPTGHHPEFPGTVPIIPLDSDYSSMFDVWISDYLINSCGYVLHNTGYLQYNVTQKDVPPGVKISLNTSKFPMSTIFPQVRTLYPDMMTQFCVVSTKEPIVETTAEKVTFIIEGELSAYVSEPNNTLTYLFTLGSQLNASFNIAMKSQNITWVSKFEGVELKLVDSAIADMKIDILKKLLPVVINNYAIPQLNNMGAIGKAIPNFQNYHPDATVVTQGKNFLKLGTDIRFYSPIEEAFEELFRLFQ